MSRTKMSEWGFCYQLSVIQFQFRSFFFFVLIRLLKK